MTGERPNPFAPPTAPVRPTLPSGPIHTPRITRVAGLGTAAAGITVGVAGLQAWAMLGGAGPERWVPPLELAIAVPLGVAGALLSRANVVGLWTSLMLLVPTALGGLAWMLWLVQHGIVSPLQGLAAFGSGTALAFVTLAIGPTTRVAALRRRAWDTDDVA